MLLPNDYAAFTRCIKTAHFPILPIFCLAHSDPIQFGAIRSASRVSTVGDNIQCLEVLYRCGGDLALAKTVLRSLLLTWKALYPRVTVTAAATAAARAMIERVMSPSEIAAAVANSSRGSGKRSLSLCMFGEIEYLFNVIVSRL